MAKQDQPDAPETTDDRGVESPEEASTSPGYFLKVIVPAFMIASLGLGGWLTYAQYDRVDEAVTATGSTFSFLWDEEEGIQYGEFMELGEIIVNPAGTQGQRYLMVALGLEANSTDALAEVENKEVVVRDTVLKILSQYTVEQLSAINHRNKTKTQLIKGVNGVLGGPKIDRLYFTQYVLQ